MGNIKVHQQRLKKFIELGAPDIIIENERSIIAKLQKAWEIRQNIAYELMNKMKKYEKPYNLSCRLFSAATAAEAKEKQLDDVGYLLSFKLDGPQNEKELFVAVALYMQSTYIGIFSDSLPAFSKYMSQNMQYKKVNELNQDNPLFKVYHQNFSDKGDAMRVTTYIDEKNIIDTDIIIERMFLLVNFIEDKTPNLEILNNIIETKEKQTEN